MSAPIVHQGEGSVARLREIVALHAARRVLLVTGRRSYRESGAEAAIEPNLEGVETIRFSDFETNPRLEDVERGLQLARQFRPELVVAVGGGSVLDMAKLINFLAAQKTPAAALITGQAKPEGRGVPLVAIPTTAGTGSEVTHFAVAYIGAQKYSLAHQSGMRPDFAIVDPVLTYRMSPQVTATTGFDALCQAIESYWSVSSTGESRAHSAAAIPLLLGALERAVRAPDPEARRAMAYGAHLAGKAIDIAKTTAAHALSYALSADYGIPHGHAVALTLGQFFRVHSELDNAVLNGGLHKDELGQRLKALFALLGCDSAGSCARRWEALMQATGLATRLSELGVKDAEELARLAAQVNVERLGNNPVSLDTRQLLRVLNAVH